MCVSFHSVSCFKKADSFILVDFRWYCDQETGGAEPPDRARASPEPEPANSLQSQPLRATSEAVTKCGRRDSPSDVMLGGGGKVGPGKTVSVDLCAPRPHHAPLERQMCLQLPEERPFLRRCDSETLFVNIGN